MTGPRGDRLRVRIVDTLSKHSDGLTANQIAVRLGTQRRNASNVLRQMIDGGNVAWRQSGAEKVYILVTE